LRDHSVHRARRAVERLAGLEDERLHRRALADLEVELAGLNEERLVLPLVVLSRKFVAGLDVKDLADVAVRLGPDDFVPPRLFDASHDEIKRYNRDWRSAAGRRAPAEDSFACRRGVSARGGGDDSGGARPRERARRERARYAREPEARSHRA